MEKNNDMLIAYNPIDPILAAIAKGYHISGIEKLQNQTWDDFEQVAKGKHLFLFGIGRGTLFCISRCKDKVIEGVVDNDKENHGIRLSWFLTKEVADICGDVCISDISILKKYKPKDVVVLITSLKNYVSIFEQLEAQGISQCFALLPMEANRRGNHMYETVDTVEQYFQKCCNTKVIENKIVFANQEMYGGHGKYIMEQLLKLRKDLDIVWLVKEPYLEVPEGVRLADSRNRKSYVYEMATAKIWVLDYLVPNYIVKRPEQIFVMVKHWASITLKSFGLDILRFRNVTSSELIYGQTGNDIDYIIVGSEFDERSCRSGFDYKGEVYYAGSPRSDVLFHPQNIRKMICEKYQMNQEFRILTYAPTFRWGSEAFSEFQVRGIELDYEKVKLALEECFGGNWYILLRLHPMIADQSSKVKKPNYVIDVSNHSDGQEIVAASDILITDYSSIMFEPAFVKKPVFLFATDRKEYINGERELLIDYDTLPFPIAESSEELVQKIHEFNWQEYEERVTKFLEKYGVHEDGHASERAAAFVSGLMLKETEENLAN